MFAYIANRHPTWYIHKVKGPGRISVLGENRRKILLVEDNPADVRLLKEAFLESGAPHKIHTAHDGQEALDFLDGQKSNTDAQDIDLIVLDINLPKVSGHEVLSAIKQDPALTKIPVLMLSSSDSPTDIRTAYDLHANAYLRKPTELTDYFELVENIQHFWLNIVRLPHRRTKLATVEIIADT